MKKELIAELFQKFEQARHEYNDVECWSARELQEVFNYTEWRNFLKVVEKAKTACKPLVTRFPTILLTSTKWSNLVAVFSGKYRTLLSPAMPVTS